MMSLGRFPTPRGVNWRYKFFLYIYTNMKLKDTMNIKKRIYLFNDIIFLQKFELPPTHIVGSAYGIQIKYKKSKIIAAKTQINGIDVKNTNIF